MASSGKFFLFATVFTIALAYSLLHLWPYFQPGGVRKKAASDSIDVASVLENSMLKQLSKPTQRQRFVNQFFEGVKLSEVAKSELTDLADKVDVSKMDDAVKAILRFTDKHVDSKVVRAKIKGLVLDKTRALRNVHNEISGLTKKLKDLNAEQAAHYQSPGSEQGTADWSSLLQDSLGGELESHEKREGHVRKFFDGVGLSDKHVTDIAEMLENFKWSEIEEMASRVLAYGEEYIEDSDTRAKLRDKIDEMRKTSNDLVNMISNFAGKLFDEL